MNDLTETNQQHELPTTPDGKYFFLLGMIRGSVEMEVIAQDSLFLRAVAAFIDPHTENRCEQELLQAIREYQANPYEPPF